MIASNDAILNEGENVVRDEYELSQAWENVVRDEYELSQAFNKHYISIVKNSCDKNLIK